MASCHTLVIRFVAALFLIQAGWPVASAAAIAAGHDEARLLCGTLDHSAQARAHAAELSELFGLGERQPDPHSGHGDCPACFAHAHSVAATAVVLDAPERPAAALPASSPLSLTPRCAAGPPLGVRAPPIRF